MTNLLSGSMRQAASYTKQNWRGLFEVTVVPLTLLIIFTLGYLIMYLPFFSKIFEVIAATEVGAEPDLKAIDEMMSGMMFIQILGLAATLISMFITGYACVRIVRYLVRGETGIINLDKQVLIASVMWALYTLGIYFLAIAAMFVGMLVLALVGGVVAAVFAASVGNSGLLTVVAVFGIIAAYAFLLFVPAGVAMRFASGMPIVALGESPDFFSEMWKQSRGFTWALTWRFIFIYLLIIIVMMVVMAAFMAGPVIDLIGQIKNLDLKNNSDQIFEMVKSLLPRFLVAEAIMLALFSPFIWFGTIWLAMVNQRLYEAFNKQKDAAAT